MNRRVFCLLLPLLLLTGLPLSAAGIYLGAGITGDADAGAPMQELHRFTESTGDRWKLFAGVDVGPHLAIEVGRHQFGGRLCCRGIADLGFSSSVDGYSGAALYRFPVRRLAPFAKAGALSWREEGETITLAGSETRSASGTGPLVGAGLDLDLGSRSRIRAEWEIFRFEDESRGVGAVSVMIRF